MTIVFDHVEHGHHARVAQPGRGLGLPEGPLVGGVIIGVGARRGDGDLLDRDVPVEQLIAATPDDAHRTAADLAVQAVTAGHQVASSHSWHGRNIHAAASEIPVSEMRIRLYRGT